MDKFFRGNKVLYKPTNDVAFINNWGKDLKNNYYIGIKTLNTIKIIPIKKDDADKYIEHYKCKSSDIGYCNFNNAVYDDDACMHCPYSKKYNK